MAHLQPHAVERIIITDSIIFSVCYTIQDKSLSAREVEEKGRKIILRWRSR